MSRSFLYVIPECYIDTYFVSYLLRTDRVNHQHSCNKVTGTMRPDEFSIGIVDYDKAKKDIYNQYWTSIFGDTEEKLCLLFFKHKTKPHYLIAINPAMESFVLKCVKDLRINLASYDLPSNLKDFCLLTKNGKLTPKDPRFKRLFKDIQPHPSVMTLQKVLEYLCTNKYQSKDDEIREIILAGINHIV